MVAAPLVPVAVGTLALATLVLGSRLTVERLLALSRHYDVPEALVGLFILSIGTSLPEIGTQVIASVGILSGQLDYAVTSATVLGGNMGSSTTQQLLLVGLFLFGVGKVTVAPDFNRTALAPMVAALGLTLAVAWDGTLGRLDGVVLLAAFVVYAAVSFTQRERPPVLPETTPTESGLPVVRDAALAVAGLLLVLVSAFVVLATVEVLVDSLQLGGSMIGVVTIGLASSLPELSTVVESVRRTTPNLALGTLIGSNVVNPLVGIGLGSVLSTYAAPTVFVNWDLPFKIALGLAFLGYVQYRDGHLDRRVGLVFFGAYFVYIVGRLVLFPGQ